MANPHAIPIDLSVSDRAQLQGWARRRKTAQALTTRARIVLACAEPGGTNGGVAEALGVSRPTVTLELCGNLGDGRPIRRRSVLASR
jgi:DNA-binding NarL/FixJ family response regulator